MLPIASALLPMTFAVLGAWLDQRHHLGFTTWRNACRAAGLSLSSLVTFTLQLLPMAVLGALAGGVAVQVIGICLRHEKGIARATLAAHGGCALGMLVGLPLCVLALPLPGLLAGELLVTAAAAWLLHRLLGGKPACAASGLVRTGGLPSA